MCNVFDSDLDGVFDEQLDAMQEPGQREAMDAAFHAMPKEKKQAKDFDSKWCRGCCYGSHCLGADPDCLCCKEAQ